VEILRTIAIKGKTITFRNSKNIGINEIDYATNKGSCFLVFVKSGYFSRACFLVTSREKNQNRFTRRIMGQIQGGKVYTDVKPLSIGGGVKLLAYNEQNNEHTLLVIEREYIT
jgi:hypothetical protein